jgi:hypothetical protein
MESVKKTIDEERFKRDCILKAPYELKNDIIKQREQAENLKSLIEIKDNIEKIKKGIRLNKD